MKVHFESVGRDKKSFSATIDELSHEELLRLVRPYLGSRDVEFATTPPGHNTGVVVVGGFRTAGTFRIEVSESVEAYK